MIATKFYEGQGLGNMLFCAITTKCIAKRNGYAYGTLNSKAFKGKHFISLDIVEHECIEEDFEYRYTEKVILNHLGKDVSPLDEFMNNIPDGVWIDGTMQSVKYFEGFEKDIKDWLVIKEPIPPLDEDICVCHVRGNDYRGAGITLLPKKYFEDAIEKMKEINPSMKFIAVTDDIELTKYLLGDVQIVGSSFMKERDPYSAPHHTNGRTDVDFKILNGAKNLIIANSSFSFWGAYSNKNNPIIIAPKFWSAHNYDEPFWSTAEMQVPGWIYIDKNGNL